jgi:hypothetical protein
VGRWDDESETRSAEVLGGYVCSLVEPRAALAWANVRKFHLTRDSTVQLGATVPIFAFAYLPFAAWLRRREKSR